MTVRLGPVALAGLVALGAPASAATAIAQTPDRPASAARAEARGDSLRKSFETEAALEAYLAGVAEHPRDTTLLWKSARTLVGLTMVGRDDGASEERLARAVELARRAVDAGPGNARAHATLAASLGLYGRLVARKYRLARAREVIEMGEEVHAHARRAIRLDPDYFAPYVVLGIFHRELATVHPIARMVAKTFLGGYPDVSVEESEAYLRRAVQLAPDDLTARLEYARTLLELDREEEAREQLRAALAAPPDEEIEREERKRARELLDEIS